MSLDGLRAWIGLVERKLTMRTRVFLVLVALAIGAAGAGIYLALDARDDAVNESELQSVREELAGEGGPTSAGEDVAGLEAQIEALRGEVAELKSEADSGAKGGDGSSTTPGGSDGGTGASAESGTGGTGSASGGATVPKTQKQLEELLDKAEEEADTRK
ncbi:MAG TPA: hypothetical protein VN752_06480 [Solirubrobacterales bacterium]|nr:hypothetical protein [Solirubrobacterales bacterium]